MLNRLPCLASVSPSRLRRRTKPPRLSIDAVIEAALPSNIESKDFKVSRTSEEGNVTSINEKGLRWMPSEDALKANPFEALNVQRLQAVAEMQATTYPYAAAHADRFEKKLSGRANNRHGGAQANTDSRLVQITTISSKMSRRATTSTPGMHMPPRMRPLASSARTAPALQRRTHGFAALRALR